MTLGFSVETLVPSGRGGGALRMGLARLPEAEWRDPAFDREMRARIFDDYPESIQILPGAELACEEVARMCGTDSFGEAARAGWEDLCLLQAEGDGHLTLRAAALGFPTDWRVEEKMGLPVTAIHAPIHGYAEQLASGVDHFMTNLAPGAIFGRTNWFVVANADWRYLPTADPARRFAHVISDNAGETLFVRCERQTLRRLPETGAILFAIGIYVAPLGSLSDRAVAHIANAVATVPSDEGARRAIPFYAEALVRYTAARNISLEAAE